MNGTKLDASFLRAVVLMTAFKPDKMLRVQAALLLMALQGEDFTSARLPGELTKGDTHVAGTATGALIAQGLLVVTGRVPSPNPDANGRKVNLLRIAEGKASTVKTWLLRNGFKTEIENQMPLL